MTIASWNVTLEGIRSEYQPGETLQAEYTIDTPAENEIQALEVSVMWHTEGKGDEDLAVHFFERYTLDMLVQNGLRQPRRFSTVLPSSPLSYDGVIVKIRWCVRIRAFLDRGKQVVEDRYFRLGSIPPARAILP